MIIIGVGVGIGIGIEGWTDTAVQPDECRAVRFDTDSDTDPEGEPEFTPACTRQKA